MSHHDVNAGRILDGQHEDADRVISGPDEHRMQGCIHDAPDF
jgi:hypothetical protein